MNRPWQSSHRASRPGDLPEPGENSEHRSQGWQQSQAAAHDGADVDNPMRRMAGNPSVAVSRASLGHARNSLTTAMYREFLEARIRAAYDRIGGSEPPQQAPAMSNLPISQALSLEAAYAARGALSQGFHGRGTFPPPAVPTSGIQPLARATSPPFVQPREAYARSMALHMGGLQGIQQQQPHTLSALESRLTSQELVQHRTTLSPRERYVASVMAEQQQQRVCDLQMLRHMQQYPPPSAGLPPPPPPFGNLLAHVQSHQMALEQLRTTRLQEHVQRLERDRSGPVVWSIPPTAAVGANVPWAPTNESVADLSPLRRLRGSTDPILGPLADTTIGTGPPGGHLMPGQYGAPLQRTDYAMDKAQHDASEGKTTDDEEKTAHEARGTYVDEITDLDVLCGRGGRSNHWPGNKRYRRVVSEMKGRYQTSEGRKSKTGLSRSIVEHVLQYGGRFVKEDEETGRYYVLSKTEARIKTSQALRESKDLKWTD